MADILFFADIEPSGGTGTFFFRILEYLSQFHSVTLILEHKYKNNIDIQNGLQRFNNIPCYTYILPHRCEHLIYRICRKIGFEIQYLYYRDFFLLKKLEKKYNPDFMFFSQGGSTKWFPVFRLKTPSIFFIHSLYTKDTHKNAEFFLQKQKYHFNAKNKIVHVSEYAVDSFKKNVYSNILASYAYCIPNYGKEVRIREKTASHSDSESICILTIGHIVIYKNPEFWMDIARKICRKYPYVEFVWAGNGEYLQYYREAVRNEPTIKFIGFRQNTDILYQNTDIYFQPSIMETQGIAVVEAMAYGIPCVVSNRGGLPESVQDKYNGFVCDIETSEPVLSAISALIENIELRKNMGKKSREVFKKKFIKSIWESKLNELFIR